MRGYKGTNRDMQCRGVQYEIGKTYHVDGEIELCENGLHFCEHLVDVYQFYDVGNSRYFEVEASGDIKTDGVKSAARELTILRELPELIINRTIYGYGNGDGNGNGYGNGYGYGNGISNNIHRFLTFKEVAE